MKTKTKGKLLNGISIAVCLIILLFFLFPYIYLVLSSFKPSQEVVTTSPTLMPSRWTMENYVTAFAQMPVGKYFGNSLIASVVSTAAAVFVGHWLLMAVPD